MPTRQFFIRQRVCLQHLSAWYIFKIAGLHVRALCWRAIFFARVCILLGVLGWILCADRHSRLPAMPCRFLLSRRGVCLHTLPKRILHRRLGCHILQRLLCWQLFSSSRRISLSGVCTRELLRPCLVALRFVFERYVLQPVIQRSLSVLPSRAVLAGRLGSLQPVLFWHVQRVWGALHAMPPQLQLKYWLDIVWLPVHARISPEWHGVYHLPSWRVLHWHRSERVRGLQRGQVQRGRAMH